MAEFELPSPAHTYGYGPEYPLESPHRMEHALPMEQHAHPMEQALPMEHFDTAPAHGMEHFDTAPAHREGPARWERWDRPEEYAAGRHEEYGARHEDHAAQAYGARHADPGAAYGERYDR